jgi:cytochrome P450
MASSMLTLQLSLVAVLEKRAPRTPAVLTDLQQQMLDALRDPVMIPGARSPELAASLRVLDAYVAKMILDRRTNPPPREEERVDLMTKLLLARDGEPDHGVLSGAGAAGMSDDQVRDEAMTLFVAGHETTANALAWAFYLLARHPEARARVQAEADSFGPEGVVAFDAGKLAFTARVFKEALRLYPPLILLGRRSVEPFTLAGERYPKGVLVFVNTYGLHHHADVWPDPDRFDPERFLPEREAARHKSAWLPFGVGPRVCIGNGFALMEGPVVMATLMRAMTFDINPGRAIEPDAFATLRPKGGVPAVVTRRDAR